MIAGLAAGMLIGLAIAAAGLVCFTDMTFKDVIDKYSSFQNDYIIAAFIGIAAFILSWFILIFIHELGHLVCGLLSGYKFVSFRVFNLTFINTGGRIRVKNYTVSGTGGQCLLSPPEGDLKDIPVWWYNFGGVLANIIVLLIAVPLFGCFNNAFIKEAVGMFILADVMMILLNGIPMKVSGVANDGYNLIHIGKNKYSKLGLINALKFNALLQSGIRPKDMSEALFLKPDNINYSNQLEVMLPLMVNARLVDEMKFKEARENLEDLYLHKEELLPLLVNEIACELLFLRLICGNMDTARQLYDNKLENYIKSSRKVMSSKERIACAVALLIDNDREKASAIYSDMLNRKDKYLHQGEVESDLEIIAAILR